MKKVLVTGGAGFIGSNFIDYFLLMHPGIFVVNFDKLTYCGNPENLKDAEKNPDYSFVKGDICDESAVLSVMKGADAVIHFAAESHVDNSIKDPFVFTKTNVLGTHVLLEAARKTGVKRFLHISTDEVYGSISEGSFAETDSLKPNSPYAASKAAAELIAQGFFRTFGFPLVMVRGSNTFGPRQYPEKLVPLFVMNLLEKRKVPLMGDGHHRRSWIYVKDFCRAVDIVLEKGVFGGVYNIPGTVELPNLEMTKKLLSLLEKDESFIEWVPNRLAHDERYSVNGERLMMLGWKSEFGFEEALKETVEWYKMNVDWWKKLKK